MDKRETVDPRAGQHPPNPSAPEQPRLVHRSHAKRVVIVGAPEDVPRALEHPAVRGGRFEVLGVLAVEVDTERQSEGVEALAQMLDAHHADTILVAGPVGLPVMRRVADLAVLHRCELLAVMPTEVPADHDPVIVWSGDSPLVQLARIPRSAWEHTAKRALDVAVALVGLIVLSPLLLVACVLIRLESPGAPIFAHERIGYRGRKFRCLKLRTMRADAEEQLRRDPAMYATYVENHYKIPDGSDPRTTPVGRFLRRSNLDELPQLWNVLAGDMSLVGPRPVVEEELRAYGADRDVLLSVRPGITGAWAVGGRHAVGYPERCQLELDYVRTRNMLMDLSILGKTLGVVVRSP